MSTFHSQDQTQQKNRGQILSHNSMMILRATSTINLLHLSHSMAEVNKIKEKPFQIWIKSKTILKKSYSDQAVSLKISMTAHMSDHRRILEYFKILIPIEMQLMKKLSKDMSKICNLNNSCMMKILGTIIKRLHRMRNSGKETD